MILPLRVGGTRADVLAMPVREMGRVTSRLAERDG